MNTKTGFFSEIARMLSGLYHRFGLFRRRHTRGEALLLVGSICLTVLIGLLLVNKIKPNLQAANLPPVVAPVAPPPPPPVAVEPEPVVPLQPVGWNGSLDPVRELPRPFRNGQRMPVPKEGNASMLMDDVDFDPKTDLIFMDDPDVWWESDNVKNGEENDHLFHYAMEGPMRRLIHMVKERGAMLRVTEAYSLENFHHAKSLHKQGRAVDITWMQREPYLKDKTKRTLPLGELGRLAWAAGFTWVYFEKDHIHASIRPDNRD